MASREFAARTYALHMRVAKIDKGEEIPYHGICPRLGLESLLGHAELVLVSNLPETPSQCTVPDEKVKNTQKQG